MRKIPGGPVEAAGAAYTEARAEAMGASTRRLRWKVRRMPKHSNDPETLARAKAIREELDVRGAL